MQTGDMPAANSAPTDDSVARSAAPANAPADATAVAQVTIATPAISSPGTQSIQPQPPVQRGKSATFSFLVIIVVLAVILAGASIVIAMRRQR